MNKLLNSSNKKYALIIAVFLALTVVVFAGMGFTKTHNVNDVGRNPQAYTGTITIAGVMGGVSQNDPSIIGIMDIKELQCTSPNCNKLFIPIKVKGQMPSLGDEVKVKGNFVNMGGNFLFLADKIKVVRNHKISG